MKSGSIVFAGTDLGLYGPVSFTLARTPEPPPPSRSTHWRIEISVAMDLSAAMSATVWARAKAVQNLVSSRREGLLEIRDENGNSTSWNATPGESSLPEVIRRGSGRVELKFHAMEPVAAGDFPLSLTVDPLNGDPAMTLHRVTGWSVRISPTRPDNFSGHRSEVATAVTFTARTAYADPLALTANRAEALIAEQARLESLSGREAMLTFPGFDRIVQFESIQADPSEGWEWIEVQAQARYVMLPGDTEAEVDFTVDATEDPGTGETRIAISGTVRAPDQATAHAKVDGILVAWRTASRRVQKIKKADAYLDGEDSPDKEWISLRFEIELSEGSDSARYTVRIETREDGDGARTVYSGTAYAKDLATLLSTVATAADNKHPVQIRSEISVELVTDDEGAEKLSQGTFTYEYATAVGNLRGMINRSSSKGQLGEWTSTIAGTLTAATLGAARTIARSLIPADVILRTDDERRTSATSGNDFRAEQETSFEFSYAWGIAHEGAACTYKDSTLPDYSRMVEERNIAGTCWAADRAAALSHVTALLSSLGLGSPTKAQLTHGYERHASAQRWTSFEFSYSFETGITGTIGHDILEAKFTLQRVGQVNHEPITEVPLSTPVRQQAFGYNIGRLVVSGSVRARQQATARAWGQARRSAAATSGGFNGAPDPPDEQMTVNYVPFNGTTATCYEFVFAYSFRYESGLQGIWSSNLTP